MDPTQEGFNDSVSSILERKVRNWLSGVIDDMRRSSPVQQWLDSLPVETPTSDIVVTEAEDICLHTDINQVKQDCSNDTQISEEHEQEGSISEATVVEQTKKDLCDDNILAVPNPNVVWKRNSLESGLLTNQKNDNILRKRLQRDYSVQSEGYNKKLKNPLFRDHSLQSDASGSSSSSVLNVLGARKVDAESVLLALGFGPSEKQQKLQRIPDRFLAPSKLNGISTEQFIKEEQHSMRMHDCGIFGYRGLTGNPHVPPSTIVAKIMECILQGDVYREEAIMRARHSIADMRSPAATHAHLASNMHNN